MLFGLFDMKESLRNCRVRLQAHVRGLHESQIGTPDGCTLSAQYGFPKIATENDLKAVIFVHGFAAEKTENGLFSEAARSLLDKGYFVLAYDWRGLAKSGGDFCNSSLEDHIRDFRVVVRWILRQAGISRSEVCAIGFSLGAAVIATAMKRGEQVGGAVFWSPATRPACFMWPRYDTDEIKEQLNEDGFVIKPGSDVKLGKRILESLRDTDLGERAFELGVPLLVCHGSDDTRIPIDASRQAFDVAFQDGVQNVTLIEFTGASHSFRPEGLYRSKLVEALSEWLDDASIRRRPSRKQVYVPDALRRPQSGSQSESRVAAEKHAEAAL